MNPLIAAIPIVLWQFVVSDQGFVATGDVDQWSWAVPTSGPGGTDAMWATNPAGQYFNDTTEQLTVSLPDLSVAVTPTLRVRHWYSIRSGDSGWFEVDNGAGWVRVEPQFGYPNPLGFTGESGGWTTSTVDLSGLGSSAQLRFVFAADASISGSGWYLSEVAVFDGDVTAPDVTPVVTPTDNEDVWLDQNVQVQVIDNQTLAQVELIYGVDGGPSQSLTMTPLGGDVWSADIPGQPANTTLDWRVEADDGEQITVFPLAGAAFRVFLAAPTALVQDTPGRTVATDVDLSWTPPNSVHPVRGYVIESPGGQWLGESSGPSTTQSLLDTEVVEVVVRARYDGGVGDASNPLALDVEVPQLLGLSPLGAFQGDRLHVRLSGQSLYLLQQGTSVDLGDDIEITQIDVLDIDEVAIDIAVAADATPGLRSVAIEGTQGRFEFPDAFLVIDGADAPGIRGVDPAEVVQGDELVLTITASAPFGGPVQLSGSDAFVFTGVAEVEGDVAIVEIAVVGNALPGVHTVVLDDGVRLWTADVVVEERVYSAQTGCGGCTSASNAPGFWMWLALPLLLRRRR